MASEVHGLEVRSRHRARIGRTGSPRNGCASALTGTRVWLVQRGTEQICFVSVVQIPSRPRQFPDAKCLTKFRRTSGARFEALARSLRDAPAGSMGQVSRYRSTRRRSSAPRATRSTSVRSTRTCPRERTRTSRRASRAWCGSVTKADARPRAVARRGGSRFTISVHVRTAARMIQRTSPCGAFHATRVTTKAASSSAASPHVAG